MNILKNAIQSKNVPNIILYGCDKKTQGDKLYSLLKESYNHSEKILISEKDFQYYKTDIYYIFNMSIIVTKNIDLFLTILDKIITTNNHFSNLEYKIVILENFELIKQSIQNILRVKIEKYRITTIFILITSNIGSIIQPLKSRCLCIRFPLLSKKEKRDLIKTKINYKELDSNFYDKLYEIDDANIILSLDKYKELIINSDYNLSYDKICQKIMNLYKYKYNSNIHEKLRNISYNILKYNLSISKFYKTFLNQLLSNNRIIDSKKVKLIKLFSESEYNFINSYRKIIIIESLLFNVYNILSDALLAS